MRVLLAVLVVCLVGSVAQNEDSYTVNQMIQARGYPLEQHYVVTPDGFILSVQRIPGPRYSTGKNPGKPVILQHGLEDNSITWVIQQVVEQSLGFIMADAGFDVWLPNIRGNTYSTNNTYLTPSQTQFWEWSFDEMSKYDLPTTIDYVLNATGYSQLSYVGHSQGTIMGFIGYENPHVAAKVNVFVALAPVAWLYNCKSTLLKFLAKLDLGEILAILGDKNFLPDTAIMKDLFPLICAADPALCENALGLVMGWDNSDLNSTRLPVILAHEPSDTSIYNMIHWSQLADADVFQAYNYGKEGNLEHYNSTTPPQYNPASIPKSLPIALFYGGNDDLADLKDVQHLMPLIPNLVYTHFEANYSHIDFVWGENAYTRIYPAVLQLVQKYSS